MHLKLRVELDNAAFVDEDDRLDAQAAAEILRTAADRLEGGSVGGLLRDVNGNTVGDWGLVGVRRA